MDTAANAMHEALQLIAPGTELREGLVRIQRSHTGALIVLGYNDEVEALCSDGFELDVEFSATRLRELSKMDGAIILDSEVQRIRRANVQLLPDRDIPTVESGMRHRTADRMAHQTGLPVISVSASMSTITIYVANLRHIVLEPEGLLARADQAINTLERYRERLDENSATLAALERKDAVTAREVATVLQRTEMVRRITAEIDDYLEELGTDGRLLALQLDDLVRGTAAQRMLIIRDYLVAPQGVSEAETELSELSGGQLIDLAHVAGTVGLRINEPTDLDKQLLPRGIRVLASVPHLPWPVLWTIVEKWPTLPQLRHASIEELRAITGVTHYRAQLIKDAIERSAPKNRGKRR